MAPGRLIDADKICRSEELQQRLFPGRKSSELIVRRRAQ